MSFLSFLFTFLIYGLLAILIASALTAALILSLGAVGWIIRKFGIDEDSL